MGEPFVLDSCPVRRRNRADRRLRFAAAAAAREGWTQEQLEAEAEALAAEIERRVAAGEITRCKPTPPPSSKAGRGLEAEVSGLLRSWTLPDAA
ncbi:MAG: hypothetical protein JXR75_04315 [Rhodobacteraceae bacterium]|nr:hypothetical protein [Paracoccaceae bacterium]